MSRLFNQIKKFYDLGLYTDEQVADFVKKGKITPAEYKKITGKPYNE